MDNEIALLLRLSNVISRRRRELALSQDQVADKAGVSRTYFSDIERARRNFSVLTLWGIARALGLNGSMLMRLAEQTEAQQTLSELSQEER